MHNFRLGAPVVGFGFAFSGDLYQLNEHNPLHVSYVYNKSATVEYTELGKATFERGKVLTKKHQFTNTLPLQFLLILNLMD